MGSRHERAEREARAPRRAASLVLLSLVLAAPFACDGRGAEVPTGQTCQGVAWGGWNGTPQCAGIAAIIIASEHRSCVTNEDCALVGVTACSAHAVRKDQLANYTLHPAPCTHPLGGVCPAHPYAAVCEQGCCVPR